MPVRPRAPSSSSAATVRERPSGRAGCSMLCRSCAAALPACCWCSSSCCASSAACELSTSGLGGAPPPPGEAAAGVDRRGTANRAAAAGRPPLLLLAPPPVAWEAWAARVAASSSLPASSSTAPGGAVLPCSRLAGCLPTLRRACPLLSSGGIRLWELLKGEGMAAAMSAPPLDAPRSASKGEGRPWCAPAATAGDGGAWCQLHTGGGSVPAAAAPSPALLHSWHCVSAGACDTAAADASADADAAAAAGCAAGIPATAPAAQPPAAATTAPGSKLARWLWLGSQVAQSPPHDESKLERPLGAELGRCSVESLDGRGTGGRSAMAPPPLPLGLLGGRACEQSMGRRSR